MFSILFLGQFGVMDYDEAIVQGMARNPMDIYATLDAINTQLAKNEAERDIALLAKSLTFLATTLSSSAYGCCGLVVNDEVLSVTTKILEGEDEIFMMDDSTAKSILTAVDAITERFNIKSALANITLHNTVRHIRMRQFSGGLFDLCGISDTAEAKEFLPCTIDEDVKAILKATSIVHPQLCNISVDQEFERIPVSNYESDEFDEEVVDGI